MAKMKSVKAQQPTWTLAEALELCTLIQSVSPKFSAHPALTGGLLYKTGPRNDADIVIYQHGDTDGERKPIDWDGLWEAVATFGLELGPDFGYVKKCTWRGKVVDIIDPTHDSDYPKTDGELDSTNAAELLGLA